MTAQPSEWQKLLKIALPALDHVFGRETGSKPRWTLGGGTAIAVQINHRISHDVDLFVPGTRLKAFTPVENPAAALISSTYQWPGHYLKFERPEGEIDFLSPPLQTDPGFIWTKFEDRTIAVETCEEVIIKKIRYRSTKFTARDAFDLAAVSQARPGLAAVIARETADALPRVQENLRLLKARGIDALANAIIPTESGRKILPDTFEIAQQVIDRAAKIAEGGHETVPQAYRGRGSDNGGIE